MTIFETDTDLARERRAIQLFVSTFGGSYQKLDQFDVDYKVFDSENNLIAYAEVKGRIRNIKDAYPLPISVKKLVKLVDKRITAVVIWACEDGIIYAKVNNITGQIKWGGRKARYGSYNDEELMAYFDKQKEFKYVRFI